MPSSRTPFRINWHSSPSPPPSVSGSPASTSRKWGWENSHPTPIRSALELLGAVHSLYTSGCTSKDPSAKLLKFADDATLIGLIQDGPAEAVLPSTVEEDQPATRAVETVLLCHHWIRPPHINNCLIQLSYQIWPQKTTEGSPDCWANHWYNPPHSSEIVLIQSEKKVWQNPFGPLTSSTFPLWTVTVWSTLQSSEYQNNQTQKVSFPKFSYLILNMEHTTILYNYLFTTQTFYFFISNLHMSDLTHNCLYCILCFCYFVHGLFVYCYFVVCVLSCYCPSVALWSFYHYNKFLMCKHTWPIKLILILLKLICSLKLLLFY